MRMLGGREVVHVHIGQLSNYPAEQGGKNVAAQLTSLILSILKKGEKKGYLQEESNMYVEKEGRDG